MEGEHGLGALAGVRLVVGKAPPLVDVLPRPDEGPLALVVAAMRKVEAEAGGAVPHGAWFEAPLPVKMRRGCPVPDLRREWAVMRHFNKRAVHHQWPWAAAMAEINGAARLVVLHTAAPGRVLMRTLPLEDGHAAEGTKGPVPPPPVTLSQEEHDAQRATIIRKLSGRGPVPGFDDVSKPGRAKRLSGGEE
ncbi:MAG: hypothetical protein IOD15_00110 [Phycisphaerales bacterium]|nr:hypothetical protein [Phycisphaerales bacterium]